MKNMKAFTIMLLILVVVFSLAACGGNESTQEPTKPVAENTPPAEENTNEDNDVVEERPPAADLNGATIRFAMWWDGTPQPGTELGDLSVERHKEVEERYNVKIEYVEVPWGEMVEKVTSTALSGEPFADIVRLEFRWLPGLIAGGYLKPLDDFLAVSKEDQLPKEVKFVGTFNNKLYGFGDSFNESGGLYYNKTLFEREGLPDPYELQQKGEWTWAAYLDAAKKLTKDTDGDGKPDQYGIGGDPTVLANFFVHSNDGKIMDDDTKKIAFDSPNAIEAYEFMASLYNDHKVVMPNEGNGWEDPRRYFTQGLVGMTQGWVWEGGGRIADMADEFGYVFWPKGPKATDYAVPVTNSNMMFIVAGSKFPKEAYEIWKELTFWDQLDEGFTTYLEANLSSEEAIDTAMQMPSKMRLENWEGYDLGEVLWGMNDRIATGEEPPATAVEKVKQEAQARVDAVLRQ